MSTQLHHNPAGEHQRTQQSRPTRDKKSNFFRRLSISPRARSSTLNHTSSSSSMPSVFRAFAPTGSGSSSSRYSAQYQQRTHRGGRNLTTMTAASSLSSNNLMEWLQDDCPQDLLPKILAFAGPQTLSSFARTNRHWNEIIQRESTWMVVCEELYKWKEGDAVPSSWKDFYKYNPCVPTDYSSVNEAFSVVRTARSEQIRSIRILLRPGRYVVREAITIQASSSVRVRIETMELPDSFQPVMETADIESEPPKRRRKSNVRRFLSCRNIEEVEEPDDDLMPLDFEEEDEDPSLTVLTVATPPSSNTSTNSSATGSSSKNRAKLILRTRKQNEPIVRIRQGCCILKNLDLCHMSNGVDIWNGNSAVQIQPPSGPDDQPMMVVPAPTAILEGVGLSSHSGRGIVNIDGGHVIIRRCFVHDCAATGIYVGGPGSRAQIEETDVVRNGNGNTHHRRGIARGHSGIYLEQGHAHIRNCNVSNNSLTGISAVSQENAFLNLEESDLISNGTFQLEMPGMGTNSFRRSSVENNIMSTTGLARTRSGLNLEAA